MKTIRRMPLVAVLCVFLLAGLALTMGSSVDASKVSAQSAPSALDGGWQTFANGDDVLAFAIQDGVMWAGTRAGGLVRWDLGSGDYVQYLRPQTPIGANTVRDIDVDTSGRLWLATNGGLTVFAHGNTVDEGDDAWFTYTTENAYGLPSDDVRAVAVDGDLVWVGGSQARDVETGVWSGGGVGRLDTNGTPAIDDDTWMPIATFTGTFLDLPDGTYEPGLVSDTINDLVVTDEGNLWVATSEHWRMDRGADPSSDPTWQRGHGGMSFLDTSGTADVSDDTWHGLSCELLDLVVTCNVRKVKIDPRGRGWAADGGRGLIQFDPTRPQLTSSPELHLRPPVGDGDGFVLDFVFGSVDDPSLTNTIWMGTPSGLMVLDHNGTLTNQRDDMWNNDLGTPYTTDDLLSRDRVQALTFVDDQLWLGFGHWHGVPGGVQPFDPASETAGDVWHTTNAPPSNFITDIAFGGAGGRWQDHVWLGTGSRSGTVGARLFGAGAVDFDTSGTQGIGDDTWTVYDAVGTDDNGSEPWSGIAGDNVHSILVDGDNVWFGVTETTWDREAGAYKDGGLSVYDGTTWTARTVANTGGVTTGLGRGGVASITRGCGDELWVATGNRWDHVGTGVFELDPGGNVHDLPSDSWVRHKYPQLASANATVVVADCANRRVWTAATHHVNNGDTGGPIGQWGGGGLSVFDVDASIWSKIGSDEGFESYSVGAIEGEAVSLSVGDDGTVWAGAYGTTNMSQSALVRTKPYWPAVLNSSSDGTTWQHQVFDLGGSVSSIAHDSAGQLWVGTTRGGAARESHKPDQWPWDRSVGGLYVHDGSEWFRLDADTNGIPSNDISVVKVAPDGSVWVGTEGWGLAKYDPQAAAPTPTATVNVPTRTPTPTVDPSLPTPTDRPTSEIPTPRPSPTSGLPTAVPPEDIPVLLPRIVRGW